MATVEVVATPIHILQGSSVTLSAQFTSDGAVADPGVTTVGIVNVAGETVVASGTATAGSGAAARTYALSATDDLDILTATWTTANLGTLTTTHEVVGRFLFSISEARAFDGAAMSNTTTYPTAAIEEARARITDQFEEICGVSFIPRYRREVFNGNGAGALIIHRHKVTDIRSVEYREFGGTAWTALTADEIADVFPEGWGYVFRESMGTFAYGRRNIRIGYEHGFNPAPFEVKDAALRAARYQLVKSNINSRAISITTEQGSEQLWTPGLSGRGKAINPDPIVDEVLQRYRDGYRTPVVA